MTSKEKILLWLLMEHPINRYLMSNAHGRWNGVEKSENHIRLVKIMMAYFTVSPIKDSMITDDLFDRLHQATKPLTDNLDSQIGFPLESRPDYDRLAPLFFEKFVALCVKEHEFGLWR